MILEKLMQKLVVYGGSDLHLKAGRPPLMRILGKLYPTDLPRLNASQVQAIAKSVMKPRYWEKLEQEKELDFSFVLPGVSRFRANAYFQKDCIGLVLRVIPLDVPTIANLGLPDVLEELSLKRQGLLLVTGPTGSGKSTTLASMINHVNHTRYAHIITIEDPIEFVYQDYYSTINQRQLDSDTLSLAKALRSSMRQDPDVILVGEMRDKSTISTALKAAETGHLVMSTLHTNDAVQTIDRILDYFPHEEQSQMRHLLSFNLIGVISQRLVPRKDGAGLIVACEVMINTPNVSEVIREGKLHELGKIIEKSQNYYKMQTLNQSLANLFHEDIITEDEAFINTTLPGELQKLLKGISTTKYQR